MSVGILEQVKEFLVRLVKDQTFRTQLENSAIDERNKVLEDAGYKFSKEEFETATIELIESKERGEFNELSEEEMVAVVGGYVGTRPIVQPMYGVTWWPWPIKPIDPIVQPMYGVPTSTDQ